MASGLDVVPPPARLRLQPSAFVMIADRGEATLMLGAFVLSFWHMGLHLAPLPVGGAWLLAVLALFWAFRACARPRDGSILGGYEQGARPARQALRAAAIILPLVLGPVYGLFGPQMASKVIVVLLPAMSLSLLWRLLIGGAVPPLVRRGRLGLWVAILGGGREAQETLQHLRALRGQGVHCLGMFDDRDPLRSPAIVEGVVKLGGIADLPVFLRRVPLDLVIVTIPPAAEGRILQILSTLWALPVDIRLAPSRTGLMYRPGTYRWLGKLALLDLFDRPLRGQDALIKRGFDLVLGAVLLGLVGPVMALIALMIRLDSAGPVFFCQMREGLSGEPIRVWKFRTLQHHAADLAGAVSVTADDPRVTRVGRVLRRYSLDELPQIFNVLGGSMSLVGPRPHALHARNGDLEFAPLVQRYGARHRVKPGMTGLAQVKGFRGPVQSPEEIRDRVAQDIDYIDTWSILLDLRILLMTLPAVVSGKNAV